MKIMEPTDGFLIQVAVEATIGKLWDGMTRSHIQLLQFIIIQVWYESHITMEAMI